MIKDNKEMLTVQEAAEYFGLNTQVVYRLIHKAEILALKVGKRFLIPFDEADRWLDEKTRPKESC